MARATSPRALCRIGGLPGVYRRWAQHPGLLAHVHRPASTRNPVRHQSVRRDADTMRIAVPAIADAWPRAGRRSSSTDNMGCCRVHQQPPFATCHVPQYQLYTNGCACHRPIGRRHGDLGDWLPRAPVASRRRPAGNTARHAARSNCGDGACGAADRRRRRIWWLATSGTGDRNDARWPGIASDADSRCTERARWSDTGGALP